MSQKSFTRREAVKLTAAGGAMAGALSGLSAHAEETGTRVALVTGCSSGFGHLTAVELARAGFTTFAGMRETAGVNRSAAEALGSLASRQKLPLSILDLDVRDSASVAHAVETAEAAGQLDVLVNNAGYILAGSIELHSEKDVQEQFETNIFGYHRLIRTALPAMRARGAGLVVQVSSGLGRIVFPTQGWYVATKFAIEGMSEALAYELAPFGVDLCIVQPTQYATQFLANGRRYFEGLVARLDSERSAAYDEQIAMTRFGLQDTNGPDPRDVAIAIRDIALMEDGARPLRQIVSPEPQGLERINAGLATAQDAVFAGTPFETWRSMITK